MHELPIVLSMLDTLEGLEKTEHFRKITDIYVTVGELSGVESDCIDLYFESASAGTAADGARIHYAHEPARLVCSACGKEFPHEKSFDCPLCGAPGKLIRGSGTDFTIDRVEGS